jgi:AcrR family transcriptional regulator
MGMARASTPKEPVRGTKGESTRTAIVQRAAALSTTVGLEGLSIGMLADDLGLSKSGLFAHFRSKEALQLAVIESATERFADLVVRPTLRHARGEPRVVAAFDAWRRWPETASYPGGCFFLAAAAEFDDRPGIVRDAVAGQIGAWLDTLAVIVRGAVVEGHFAPGLDPEQFVFEFFGILLSYHQLTRLLKRAEAAKRVERAFAALLTRSRTSEPAPRTPTSTRATH